MFLFLEIFLLVGIFKGIIFPDRLDRMASEISFFKAVFQAYNPKDFTNPHKEYIEFLRGGKTGGSLFDDQGLVAAVNLTQDPYYKLLQELLQDHTWIQDKDRNVRILIVGPGSGTSVKTVHELFPESNVVAIDLEPAVARRLKEKNITNLSVAGDGTNAPFLEGSFDIVIGQGVIRYIATKGTNNLEAFIDELCRLVKDDGIILLQDGMIKKLMEQAYSFLSDKGFLVYTGDRKVKFHRHTMFYIMYYEYFIKKNAGFRDTVDALRKIKGGEQNLVKLFFELAGYRKGEIYFAISFGAGDIMID